MTARQAAQAPKIVIAAGLACDASAVHAFRRAAGTTGLSQRTAAAIDKRLDVIAAPPHVRGAPPRVRVAAHDCAAPDLAHAPPSGLAKNPVQMAAFVAQDDPNWPTPLVQPEAKLTGPQAATVRAPTKAAARRLDAAPGALDT